MGILKWLARLFKNGGVLNIMAAAASILVCAVSGYLLLGQKPDTNWIGVGQSLVAGAVVSTVSLIAAIAQYLFVTKRYDTLVALGIRRFRRRGDPGSKWPDQLREVKYKLLFFGKDHNRLVDKQKHNLTEILINGTATIHFYLLAADSPYYRESTKQDYDDRITAATALFDLRDQVAAKNPTAANRLILKQYEGRPSFTCTILDKCLIFGPYVPDLPNHETPEFEIEPAEETWLYDACNRALDAAIEIKKVKELERPSNPAKAAS